MMKPNFGIPASFKLFGEDWTVRLSNDESQQNFGECVHARNEITLYTHHNEKAIPDSKVESTFYHELAHVILFAGEYRKQATDEKLVSFIGGCFHQFMKTRGYDV